MRIIKYSKGTSTSINGNNNNTSSDTTISSSVGLDRTIWGQYDDGDDIDGSMVVNGNITIKVIEPPTYDEEEDDADGEDEEEETGGGNLNVEGSTIVNENLEVKKKITANEAEIKNCYVTETPYINYPKENGKKTDIRDLFKDHETKITSNTNEINNLKTRVTNAENTIKNHSTLISNNTTAINNNTTEINKLKNALNDANDNINSMSDLMPIGSIIMYNGTSSTIPNGWAICDGSNGTPNLIDRFVRGGNYAGITGGSDSFTLGVSNLPPHTHKVAKAWYGQSDNANDRQCLRWESSLTGDALANQAVTESTGSGLAVYHLPPYYTLIYIMKIA